MMKKFVVGLSVGLLVLMGVLAAYVYITNRPLPQTEHDVAILERTLVLLNDTEAWSKSDDRRCEPEEIQQSLYCALRQASTDVSGAFQHRAAALEQVRYAIDAMKPNNAYEHRLMDFNNDPTVTLDDVHLMLRKSIYALEHFGRKRP